MCKPCAGDDDEDDAQNEARKVKVNRTGLTQLLSALAVEEHMINHLPFRSWCAHCVKGKGVAKPHRRERDREEKEYTEIMMDYMFMV